MKTLQVRKQFYCKDCGTPVQNASRKLFSRCRPCWLKWLRANPDKLPHWKGGRVYNQRGYVWVFARQHPSRNKYTNKIAEHRLVMEKQLGRYLLPGEVVHHINGIRDDNRPENLIVTTQGQHMHNFHRIATHCKMCGKPGQMRRGYCYTHYERWRAIGFAGTAPAPDKLRRTAGT